MNNDRVTISVQERRKGERRAQLDPARPIRRSTVDRRGTGECPHDLEFVRDDYGSLAEGGSYSIYRCRLCGARITAQLPD